VLDNAVKYTLRGSITLSLDMQPGCDPERVRLIFEIRDTGVGIAVEDQARIFERFVRVPGTVRAKGAGLGLAIALQMVELLGGTIQVESAPGSGSCFRVELPAEYAPEPVCHYDLDRSSAS